MARRTRIRATPLDLTDFPKLRSSGACRGHGSTGSPRTANQCDALLSTEHVGECLDRVDVEIEARISAKVRFDIRTKLERPAYERGAATDRLGRTQIGFVAGDHEQRARVDVEKLRAAKISFGIGLVVSK